MLVYGIPAFRLPKDVVRRELDKLRALDVDIRTNWVGGRTVTIDSLFAEGYQAVFVGVGAGLPQFLNVPGENIIGVFSANEYLTRANLGRAYEFPAYDTPTYPGRRVSAFGAGNVAMDAARTAARLGAESVHIVYRRGRAGNARPPGGNRTRVGRGRAPCRTGGASALCGRRRQAAGGRGVAAHGRLGEPDASGRRSPRPLPGDTFMQETDLAIVALGTRPNPLLLEATPLDWPEKRATSWWTKPRARLPFPTCSPGATS